MIYDITSRLNKNKKLYMRWGDWGVCGAEEKLV